MPTARSQQIAKLNDMFRETLGVYGGKVVITPGIQALSEEDRSAVLEKVERYTDFNKDNDSWEEHDFGSFIQNGEKIFWKIDYYDKAYHYGSEDPADSRCTNRVLTILLAAEY